MTQSIQDFKTHVIATVLEFLEEKIKAGGVVQWSVPVADGYGQYRIDSDGLYVGGSYGSFAGMYVDNLWDTSIPLKAGYKIKNTFKGHTYEVHFTKEEMGEHMDFTTACAILDELS